MYYIYVLRCDDDSLYTGITTDLSNRLKEHYYKLDTAAKYTRTHNVVSLELVWQTENRSLALKREYAFKTLSKIQKEAIIKQPVLLVDNAYKHIEHASLAQYVMEGD